MKELQVHQNPLRSRIFVFIPLILLFSACQEDDMPEQAIHAAEINDYLTSLQYNASTLLNVQPTGNESTVRNEVGSEAKDPTRQGGYNISCIRKDYNLQANFEEVAILRPTGGIIFPGALVVGDEEMLDGTPVPLQIKRAPVKLRVDLPGMGENGNIVVENPEHSNVQAKIDEALEWWNNNAYQEGYVNPAYISYKTSSSYSSEQLAIDVGLNVAWASNDVSSQFSYTTSTTRKVAMMTFKQGFYAVTMNTPENPSAVFSPEVTLSEIEGKINSTTPAAYVHSVIYGRIIMFRMETTQQVTSAEVEAALKYATGVTTVSGSAETKIKSILANASTTVITLGGNAAVASEAVGARNFGDLEKIIKGENALYSKNNPGVPIAYTIRYLKDNQLAKMGYTTDYAVEECSRALVPGARISVQNDAGYFVRFKVRYKDAHGNAQTKSTNDYSAGFVGKIDVPDGAHDLVLDVDFRSAFDWFDLFEERYPIPTRKCHKVWGTLFDQRHAEITCN